MKGEGQKSSGESSQADEEGRSQTEKKRVIIAMTRILGSETLDEESHQLLEQLADCIQRPQTEVTREAEPVKQAAAQQVTPAGGDPVETEPAELPTRSRAPTATLDTTQRRKLSADPCAPCQRTDGCARCHRAQEGSIASRTAGFSTKWTRRTDSSWPTSIASAWAV